MALDVYNSKGRYDDWKKEAQEYGIPHLSKINTKLVLDYIIDMEHGRNIARGTKKGGRSHIRLNALSVRIPQIIRWFGLSDIRKLKEKQAVELFSKVQRGEIKRQDGTPYKSVADHCKDFKSFWHWIMKVSKKENKHLEDITTDLDTSKDENKFVYFTKEELENIMPYFTEDEQTRMLFMFDTIIRSPTELMNVKVSDIDLTTGELNIKEETSKTYGRMIKLLLCNDALKEYIKIKELKDNDYLFKFSPSLFNKKLKRVAAKVYGEKISKGGKPYKELTQYDFRHSGACHWRKGAYRSKIDALMYRGGWSNLDMLNYYTKKIGMKDSIEKEDLLVGVDKTEMEKEIEKLKKQNKNLDKKLEIVLGEKLQEVIQQQSKEFDEKMKEIWLNLQKKKPDFKKEMKVAA